MDDVSVVLVCKNSGDVHFSCNLYEVSVCRFGFNCLLYVRAMIVY